MAPGFLHKPTGFLFQLTLRGIVPFYTPSISILTHHLLHQQRCQISHLCIPFTNQSEQTTTATTTTKPFYKKLYLLSFFHCLLSPSSSVSSVFLYYFLHLCPYPGLKFEFPAVFGNTHILFFSSTLPSVLRANSEIAILPSVVGLFWVIGVLISVGILSVNGD